MFMITGSFMPPPPEGFQPPIMWGTEEHVRELFEPLGFELEFERKANVFTDESVEAYSRHFYENFGPMVAARAGLGDERFAELTAKTDELFAGGEPGNGRDHADRGRVPADDRPQAGLVLRSQQPVLLRVLAREPLRRPAEPRLDDQLLELVEARSRRA